MMDFNIVISGLTDALTLYNLFFVLSGVVIGQLVGALPGIGPVMAMAIAIPFTFTLNPLTAIAFLVGVNKGGLVGGAIPAVLINTPGTPDAAATALDLDFIPVVTEQYDLIIAAEHFESENIQLLLDAVNSQEFKRRVNALGGYSTEKTGSVME